MTDERLAAALKAVEGAKPGPWRIRSYAGEHDEAGAIIVGPAGYVLQTDAVYGGWPASPQAWRQYYATAHLIALAPALPAALRLAMAVDEHSDWWRYCAALFDDLATDDGAAGSITELRAALSEFINLLPTSKEEGDKA